MHRVLHPLFALLASAPDGIGNLVLRPARKNMWGDIFQSGRQPAAAVKSSPRRGARTHLRALDSTPTF